MVTITAPSERYCPVLRKHQSSFEFIIENVEFTHELCGFLTLVFLVEAGGRAGVRYPRHPVCPKNVATD